MEQSYWEIEMLLYGRVISAGLILAMICSAAPLAAPPDTGPFTSPRVGREVRDGFRAGTSVRVMIVFSTDSAAPAAGRAGRGERRRVSRQLLQTISVDDFRLRRQFDSIDALAGVDMGVPACIANTISVGAVYDANLGS